jgi:uncharacterized damage-inducible protein DinB
MFFNVEAWTAIMQQRPEPTRADLPAGASLSTWHERAYDAFAAFARRIHDDQWFDATFTDAFEQQMTYGGAFLHVILHNAGHREEVLHILARLGVPNLPEVDHGLWDFVRRGLYVDDDSET